MAFAEFAAAFHLNFDNETGLYLVNDTVHAQLREKNPTVTISFGKTADPAQRVNVALPYAAFDLQASLPIYSNPTNYFPIRRAKNESMYTLGRAFMQEAYLKVDYERGNFSIHQALFPDTNVRQQIVTILSPGSVGQTSATQGTARLTPGAIAGIVIGDIAALFIIILLGLWLFERRIRRAKPDEEPTIEKTIQIDGELADETRLEKDGPAVYEADSAGLVELHYQGLRVNVDADRSYELSGYGSTPVRIMISPSETQSPRRANPMARTSRRLSVSPSIVFGNMKGEVPDTRRFSFSSQTSTWI